MKMKRFVLSYLVVTVIFLTGSFASAAERIAYSHLTDGYWQIWVMDPDGGQRQQVTFSQFDKRNPTWVKHQKSILFRTHNGQLYLTDLGSSNERPILSTFNNLSNPHYNEARDEIVFIRFVPDTSDASELWKAGLADQTPQMLTFDHGPKYHPSFSHDGSKITFSKADEKNFYHIWVMDSNGAQQRQITSGEGFDFLPYFSPEQNQIVFTSNHKNNNYDIYTVDVETGEVHQLTMDIGLDTSGSFSLDGERIVFVSNRTGSRQIWTMKKDGSDPRPVTHDSNESIDPVWIDLAEE